MKKMYWVFGIVAFLLIVVMLTYYFVRIEPYRKITSHLKSQNWSAATALCRSKLMNDPNNVKYMGFLFYARMRAVFDERMRTTLVELDDEDISEVNRTLYESYTTPELLSHLLILDVDQYILDNNLFNKKSDFKNHMKQALKFTNRMLSTNFVRADKIAQAVQFMSEFGMNKLSLEKGDVIDNYYYNIFLAIQSASGNTKADDILLKRLTVDSSISQLFPICGEGLLPKLTETLKAKPDILDKEDIFVYLAIMKAADMIKDINTLYPSATNVQNVLKNFDSEAEEKMIQDSSKEMMLEAWNYLGGKKIHTDSNLFYNKKRSEVLKSNKYFDMNIRMVRPEENDEPVIMTVNIYDRKKQQFVMWPHVFNQGEFLPMSIENKTNPIESEYIHLIRDSEETGGKQLFTLGTVMPKKESYKETNERYNPRKYRYYDYWYGYYYDGGWDTYTVTKYRDTVVLTDLEQFRLIDTKASFEKNLEEKKVNDINPYLYDFDDDIDEYYWDDEYYDYEDCGC